MSLAVAAAAAAVAGDCFIKSLLVDLNKIHTKNLKNGDGNFKFNGFY
jgi:hypothetical protein